MSKTSSNIDILISAFDWFDKPIAIYDSGGVLLDMNKKALGTYGIKDKKAFLALTPNFFDSPSFKSAFDPRKLASRDVTTRVYFDFDQFNEFYKGIGCKKGRALHYLRIHPLYDESGKMQFILVFTRDLTDIRRNKATINNLRDSLPLMMNVEGITTWTYDIESGRRILDAGSHLFPSLEYMDDFVSSLYKSDVKILENILTLLKMGKKTEGHAILRFVDKARANELIYLETFCMPDIVDGKVSKIFFLTKDVTLTEKSHLDIVVRDRQIEHERNKLKSANTLLHTLIDRMPCMFYAKDADNDFKYCMANSMFCEHVGLKITEVIGRTDKEVIPSEEKCDEYHRTDITAIAKGSVSFREETNFGGVRRIWRTIKYFLETSEARRLVISISQEVTDIYDAYDEVKEAKIEAERSDKMKTAFLHVVSHELITPLNSVLGFSQLLLEPSTDEERRQYEKEITENGRVLKETINEIVELAKVESGNVTLRKETFDLSEYFRKIEKKYAPQMSNGVEFKIDIPYRKCMVTLDKSYLSKIIHRGVVNAMAYTFNGYIKLGFKCVDSGVEAYLEDTGVGLSEEEMAAISEQSEKINGFTESLAMSLSLCKIMVKIMGGTIDFSSSKGKVSKTKIWVPAKTVIEKD